MDVISSLPRVTGEVVYLAKAPEKPHTYTFDPPDGVPKTNIVNEAHTIPIFDMRPLADGLTLDVQGFALVDAPTSVTDFYDEKQLTAMYYREAEDLVKQATGASRVVVFDHTIRRRTPGVEDRTPGTRHRVEDLVTVAVPQVDVVGARDDARALVCERAT